MVNKQRKPSSSGKRRGGGQLSSSMKKQRRKERAQRAPVSRFRKNLKHIERSQEAMEALRRQQDAEKKYRKKMNTVEDDEDPDMGSAESGDEDDAAGEDHFDVLVRTFISRRKGADTNGKKRSRMELETMMLV